MQSKTALQLIEIICCEHFVLDLTRKTNVHSDIRPAIHRSVRCSVPEKHRTHSHSSFSSSMYSCFAAGRPKNSVVNILSVLHEHQWYSSERKRSYDVVGFANYGSLRYSRRSPSDRRLIARSFTLTCGVSRATMIDVMSYITGLAHRLTEWENAKYSDAT